MGAVQAAPEAPSKDLPMRSSRGFQPLPTRAHKFVIPRAAVAVGATMTAFGSSVGSLLTGFPSQPVLGLLPVAAIMNLALLAQAARRRSSEPEIHDRYLDYILGVFLLGVSVIGMTTLPRGLSIFFWSWRLDILLIGPFLAGAVCLLCGFRSLWRFRLPIAFLLFWWPLPYVAAGADQSPVSALFVVAIGIVFLVRGYWRDRHQPAVSHEVPAAGDWVGSKGGALTAAALILATAALTAPADSGLAQAGRLIRADGRPKISSGETPTGYVGATPLTQAHTPPFPALGGLPREQAHLYRRADGSTVMETGASSEATAVELFAPREPSALSIRPSTLALAQGYWLKGEQTVDLGSAVYAHFDVYGVPGGEHQLLVIWWDWPVRSGQSTIRERAILERFTESHSPSSGESISLVDFATDLVKALISASDKRS